MGNGNGRASGVGEGGGRDESPMKRLWDGIIIGHPGIVIAALLIIALAQAWSFLFPSSAGAPNPDGFQRAEMVRVVDGDTLQVLVDGQKEKVRLIGINSPESVAPEEERNTEEGVEASNYTKSLVGEGDVVWLESDVNDRDQYGRLLRYVWLEKPGNPNDRSEIEAKMLNGILVAQGYAQARRYGDDVAHSDVLEQLGREAADSSKGVSDFWN